jgi:hypothetical protein
MHQAARPGDVVGVALAGGLVERAGAAGDERQYQDRPHAGDSERDEESERRGDQGHHDAGHLQELDAVAAIGQDAGRDAGEQERKIA